MTAGCLRPFSTLLTGKKASRSAKLFCYGPLIAKIAERFSVRSRGSERVERAP